MKRNIRVLQPTIDAWTKAKLMEVLDSGWWGQASVTAEFEKAFAKRIGVKHAVAVNSGTAALDLALKAHDFKGGLLLTTPMTFVADAIVGPWNGMDVIFADIEEESLCLDPDAIQALDLPDAPDAIIAVHSHGRLANIQRMKEMYPNTLIIEDCAHACHTPGAGLMGDVAIWSFQTVKTLPAGDGGMVTTNDDDIAEKLRSMTWLGIEKSTYARAQGAKYSWDYDIVRDGLKAYMNDINAALALGGLKRIDQIMEKRQKIQRNYNAAFEDLPGVWVPQFSHTVQYYTLRTQNRDAISEALAAEGIATSVHFKPVSEMTYWKHAKKYPLPVTDRVWPELLSLPCHDALTADDQTYIIDHFTKAAKALNG